ncbi:Co2+/Mg2+ efflux protein ApaG [Simiduia sp. 21SJ11W-1]|uniref:Co2+/Mg2+ efflux protein ApaG n=1 Tax=Simiduia sp. 21SJ11W-1 TaxID=2909669 RepID=UPI00209CA3B8|nr:Co2+/Mg2+ efflux protein ApaG [Simiduia sp. 21SJ11W-1]UTA48608.1 Co2+/Mg2+ efflux protein ApaG [Simiduia sp. 21SJ11W-1]
MAKDDIRIQVKSLYLPDQSDPKARRFVFAYTIKIKNAGAEPAKLMSRHWKILDGNNQLEEVRGDGVIGEQPRLLPGGEFTYSSGAILKTPTGTMEGSYRFRTDDGRQFEAPIPLFALAMPGALH